MIAASPTRQSTRATWVPDNKRVTRLNHGREAHLTEIEEKFDSETTREALIDLEVWLVYN